MMDTMAPVEIHWGKEGEYDAEGPCRSGFMRGAAPVYHGFRDGKPYAPAGGGAAGSAPGGPGGGTLYQGGLLRVPDGVRVPAGPDGAAGLPPGCGGDQLRRGNQREGDPPH